MEIIASSRNYSDGISIRLQAEALVAQQNPDKEYLPITGLASFTKNAAKLAYGADSAPLTAGSVSNVIVSRKLVTDVFVLHRLLLLSPFLELVLCA